MKAIIPAAGLGTRFLPVSRVVPKEMLPIGNRPALQVIVDEALKAGAEEIVLVISHAKELIRRYFESDPAYANRIRWTYQEEQRGLGHAVLQARTCIGCDAGHLLILLGDALVSGCEAASEMVAVSKAHGNASVIGCERVPPEKVSRYGILKLEGERIVDLVEKPALADAPSDCAIAGRYLLDAEIFRYLETQTPGKGGEIQLTDAIRRMLTDGRAAYAYAYPGRRQDIGNPDGYFNALMAFRSCDRQEKTSA